MMGSAIMLGSLGHLIAVPVAVAVLTAALTLLITRLGAAADRRRDRYAQAVQTLVAWIEFPYRVRRRTGDDPATLQALADLGHDLQERLACHQAWIATERPATAVKYAGVRASAGKLVGPACVEAWNSPPVTAPSGMNLGEWGPSTACATLVTELQHHIEHRFGLRRLTRP